MSYSYLILGAGMQGVAAAYDLARFGHAKSVTLADLNLETARKAVSRLEPLCPGVSFYSIPFDAKNLSLAEKLFTDVDGIFSAVPYMFNAKLARVAVKAKTHFCDLGGNTAIVLEEHALDSSAKAAGISTCADCGLAPGLGNLLAAFGIKQLKSPTQVHIRCGGLPQHPKPPLNYHLVFSVEGLLNEYFGKAVFLRGGKIIEVDTFAELEKLDCPAPIGQAEAFVTSGGTSTAPWSFQNKLTEYDYKTIRYPGHYQHFKTLLELGFLDTETWEVGRERFVPRELLKKMLAVLLTKPEEKDLVFLRVVCQSAEAEIRYELLDFHDEATGFSAMARTTAFSAAAILALQVQGKIPAGSTPIELSVPGELYLDELKRRGINITVHKNPA